MSYGEFTEVLRKVPTIGVYLPSEEKIFKDLCRRVKKCYWLNPEAKSKWNTGDSVIGRYTPYVSELTEVTNTASLIKFLCELQN